MRADGADLIDIGGESSRPGAVPWPRSEELARVMPLVATLAAKASRSRRHAQARA
jgi:dihydropteroate synthase